MLSRSVTSNNALSLEGTTPPGTPLQAGHTPVDRPGRLAGGFSTRPSHACPKDPSPLLGPNGRSPAGSLGTSSVELLPTVEARQASTDEQDCFVEKSDLFRRSTSETRPSRDSRRFATRTTDDRTIRVRDAEVPFVLTRGRTSEASTDSEPFDGGPVSTGRQLKRCVPEVGFTDSTGEPVAVGGVVVSFSQHADRTLFSRDRTGFQGTHQVDPNVPSTVREHAHSGTDFNITCTWRSSPRAGFHTRVGAIEAGWCDVSSFTQSRSSEFPDVVHPFAGESFLTCDPDRRAMHQEDGIDDTRQRQSSFRELSPVAFMRQMENVRASRVPSEKAAYPADDPRGADPPVSAMLMSRFGNEAVDLEGSDSFGGAGFSTSFFKAW